MKYSKLMSKNFCFLSASVGIKRLNAAALRFEHEWDSKESDVLSFRLVARRKDA